MKIHPESLRKVLKRYPGRAVEFQVDRVTLPDGKVVQREYMRHPGAVGVLAFVDPQRVILVRQYHHSGRIRDSKTILAYLAWKSDRFKKRPTRS